MSRTQTKEILVALGTILLPNVAVLVLANLVGLSRPWFNVDYAAAALLFVMTPFWLSITAFCIFFLFDVAAVFGQMMPFMRLQDALYLSQFMGIAPTSYQLIALFILFLAALCVWFFWRLRRWSSRATVLGVANVFIYVYLISVFAVGTPKDDSLWRVSGDKWLASQSVFNLDVRSAGFVDSFHTKGEPFKLSPYDGVTDPLFTKARANSEKILLVVVESWGVSSAPVMAGVLQPLLSRKDSFEEFERGDLPFSGFTVAGELRELCQYYPRHFNLKSVTKGAFEPCLPNRLQQVGYRTMAMHGAAGTMYDRAFWYPRAGFERTVFFETKAWKHRCYSFPGACDHEMISEIPKFFAEINKGFFYWLTLNSHYFYDKRDVHLDRFDCKEHGMESDPEVCRNLKLQAQFFYFFAKMLERPEMKNVEVMIVGDHPPVISNTEDYESYFKKNRVPWIKLRT